MSTPNGGPNPNPRPLPPRLLHVIEVDPILPDPGLWRPLEFSTEAHLMGRNRWVTDSRDPFSYRTSAVGMTGPDNGTYI